MMDWERISAELDKPLDRAHVKPPPQGKYGEYIEAWWAQAEANRIFGHGGWSQHVLCMECVSETPKQIGNPKKDGWEVVYVSRIRIVVDGVVKEDEGDGTGVSVSKGEAHASARKEAVSDGIKRCLKAFGWPFGLALYDKTKANVADTAAIERQAHEDAEAKTKIDLMQTCDTLEELAEMWRELPTALKERKDVTEAKDARKDELMPDNPVAA